MKWQIVFDLPASPGKSNIIYPSVPSVPQAKRAVNIKTTYLHSKTGTLSLAEDLMA